MSIVQLTNEALAKAQQGQFDAAKTLLEEALVQDNSNAALHANLGNVLTHLKQYQAAKAAYDQSLQLRPNHIPTLNNLARLESLCGNTQNAITLWQHIINTAPDFALARFNLATALLQQQQFQPAKTQLEALLPIAEEHHEIYNQLAQIYLTENNLSRAAELIIARLQHTPDHAPSLLQSGQIKLIQGDYTGSAEDIHRAIALGHQDDEQLGQLGIAYLQMRRYDSALQYLLQQMQHQASLDTYYHLGLAYAALERHREAIIYFDKALQLDSNHTDTLYNLAAQQLKVNRVADAIHSYQQLLNLKPDDIELRYILSALQQKDTPTTAPARYAEHLFDDYAERYDEHLQIYLQYQLPQTMHDLVNQLGELPAQHLSILDLGCGTGLVGRLFRDEADHLVGIDISQKMLAIAERRDVYDQLLCADVLSALPTEQKFDLMLAGELCNYIGELATLCQKVRASLKPNGVFCFSVEASNRHPFQLQQNIRYAHHQQYVQDTLINNGFAVIAIENARLRKQYGHFVEGYCVLAKAI